MSSGRRVGPSAKQGELSDEARAVLNVLVAVEFPLTADVLWRVDALEGLDVAEALVELEAASAIRWVGAAGAAEVTADGRESVEHPGLAPLGRLARARLRGAAGRAARDCSVVPPALAAEWLLDGCQAEPDPEVPPSLLELASRLQRAGDISEAVAVLRVVLAAIERGLVVSPVARVQIVSRLGFLLRFAGMAEEAGRLAVRTTATARATGDPYALAAAALAWRPESINVSDDPSAVSLVDEALSDGRIVDDDVRARLLASRAESLVFTDLERAQRDAAAALELARQTDDADAFVVAAYAYRVAHWHPGRQQEMLALGSEMVARAPRAVDYAEFGACTRLQVFLELGDWAHLDGELAAMARRLAHAPRPLELLWFRVTLAARAQTRGAWDEADRLIAAALDVARGPEYGHAFQLLLTQQLLAAWHRGDDLTSLLSMDLLPAGPMRASWEAAILGWTCTHRSSGDVVAELDRLMPDGLGSIRADLTFGPVTASLAMAAVQARSARHARQLYEGMSPYVDQWAGTGGAVVLGPYAFHLGRLAAVLARNADAHGLLTAANASAREGGCDVWSARAELALAELATIDRRHRSAMRRHARRAREIAASLGMSEVQNQADRLLGQAPRPAGLSSREIDVLRLLSTGASNQAIADELHLSIKTVERHLLNAYRKAGVRNRAEAAAFVFRELSD